MPNPQSNISRWVTFLVAPLVLLVSSFIAIKAKTWFNYDLSPAAAAAYLFSIVGGVAAVIWKWVHNRGLHELATASGMNEEQLNHIVSTIEEKLPQAPSAATTEAGSGAPASPRAPGEPLGGPQPPTPPAGVGG